MNIHWIEFLDANTDDALITFNGTNYYMNTNKRIKDINSIVSENRDKLNFYLDSENSFYACEEMETNKDIVSIYNYTIHNKKSFIYKYTKVEFPAKDYESMLLICELMDFNPGFSHVNFIDKGKIYTAYSLERALEIIKEYYHVYKEVS